MQQHKRTTGVLVMGLIIFLSVGVLPASAQTDDNQQGTAPQVENSDEKTPEFSDKELKQFAKIMKKIRTLQSASNKKIEGVFSNSTMSKQRFNTLYTARRQNKNGKAKDETQAETKEFQQLATQIQSIQQKSQQQMVQAVQQSGMTVQQFNSMVKTIRSNPELGKKVQKFM